MIVLEIIYEILEQEEAGSRREGLGLGWKQLELFEKRALWSNCNYAKVEFWAGVGGDTVH